MSITREALQDLVDTYGDGSHDNIDHIVTTNSDLIRMDWYKRPGRGVQWVDKDLGDGKYRTGVELYGPIPHSAEESLDENAAKTITFIDVEMIDRIGFKAPTAPDWEWKATNADLKFIRIGGVVLREFDRQTTSYTINLPKGTTTIPFVEAGPADYYAKVAITQAFSPDGEAKIEVTAGDGETTKTYIVNFVIDPSNNTFLSSISIDGNPLDSFDKYNSSYKVKLDPRLDIPTVSATAEDPNASVEINQASSLNGIAQIIVTAENGKSKRHYMIQFYMVQNESDANLLSILIDGVPIQGFNKDITHYNVFLPPGTVDVPEITAVPSDNSADVDIISPDDPNGTAVITVVAKDGITKKIYTVKFTVNLSGNNNLKSISLNGNPLQGFNKDKTLYEVELPYGTTEAPIVEAEVEDSSATLQITQADNPNGVATIIVTAEDGTNKTYTIQFSVALNNNADLSELTYNGNPVPNFDKNTLNYNVELPYGTTEAPVVDAVPEDSNASVDITQADDPNGTATITVTAENGIATKTYTIQFSVALNNNADLSELTYNGNPVPNFDKNTLNYNVELPYGTTEAPVVVADAKIPMLLYRLYRQTTLTELQLLL